MLSALINNSPLFYLIQSFWRDEAFSVFVAQRDPLWIIQKLSFEPPLYYILLHFWMKLFGAGEVAARGFSLLGFALATVIVIGWAEQLFKKHWLSWFLPLFFFFNPFLLYYGFEVRAYGWYMFFATAALYTFWAKKWKWYVASVVLGFYTHVYLVIIPFVQAIHYLLTHPKLLNIRQKSWFSLVWKDPMIRSMFAAFVGMSPWLYKMILEAPKLKNSWYFPVDWNLIRSVLGNMFLGYEGTPWYLWPFTTVLSVLLIGLFAVALRRKVNRSRNSFFALMIFVPLTLIIGISFAKPLFVNRYLLPVTIAEVFLVVFAIEAIKKPVLQKAVAAVLFLFIMIFNSWYPAKHAKLNIRDTLSQVNALQGANDVVLADSPLIFFESIYYSDHPDKVFLYNPNHSPFPWFVGDIIVANNQMVDEYPPYPTRAFLIHKDGSFEIVYNAPISYNPAPTRRR